MNIVPRDAMRIPDYCEAITGWRCWNARGTGVLHGQAVQLPWPEYAPFVARCIHTPPEPDFHPGSPAPVSTCSCGIYAFKTRKAAEVRASESYADLYLPVWGSNAVWGAVALWGIVVEHRIGYRAQFAYPTELYCEDAGLAENITAIYGVPCQVVKLPRLMDDYYTDRGPTSYWGMQRSSYAPFLSRYVVPPQAPPYRPLPDLSSTIGQRIIVGPSPRTVRLLGGDRFQQHQAAQSIPRPTDWRAIMRRAFHVPPVVKDEQS